MLRFGYAFVALSSFFMLMVGCSGGGNAGPKTVPASGKVTYKNLPVEGATVTFFGDAKAPPALAITDSSGEFILTTVRSGDGAVPGSYQVVVTKIMAGATKAAPKGKMSMEDAAQAANAPPPSKPLSMLPDKYASAESSGLKYEVTMKGPNVFDIKLED